MQSKYRYCNNNLYCKSSTFLIQSNISLSVLTSSTVLSIISRSKLSIS
nr:MAG TPA: hypothetical protein [Caudoviricetes sp.]